MIIKVDEVKEILSTILKEYEEESKRFIIDESLMIYKIKLHYNELDKDNEFSVDDIHFINNIVTQELKIWKIEHPLPEKKLPDNFDVKELTHIQAIDYFVNHKIPDDFEVIKKELTKFDKVLQKVKLTLNKLNKVLRKLFSKSKNNSYLGNHSLILFHIVRHGLLWNYSIRPTPRLIFNYLVYWVLVRIGLYNLFSWEFDNTMIIHMVQFGYKPLNFRSRKEFIKLQKGKVKKLVELEFTTSKLTKKQDKQFKKLYNKYRCNIPQNLI